jgi:DNA-binding response OmpR family regulator
VFRLRHHNRLKFPTRHVLVCEDVLANQAGIARHLCDVFEHEGEVVVSFVPGAAQAAAVMQAPPGVHLVILDRDMPHGNGDDLLEWFAASRVQVPVLTFSGIPGNNDALIGLGAHHRFEKQAVIDGAADALIKQILGVT